MRVTPPPHWYTLPRAEAILNPEYITHDPSLVPPFTHLYRTRLPEITIRKTFDTRSNCTRPSRKPMALIPLVGNPRGQNRGDLTRMRTSWWRFQASVSRISVWIAVQVRVSWVMYSGLRMLPLERECINVVEEGLSLEGEIVRYSSESLSLTLSRNEKVEQHIRKKTHKPNALRF